MTAKPIEQQIEIFSKYYNPSEAVYPHSCLWGDFNFCLNGIFEYNIEGQHHLSPPSYGLWIPPQTEHCSAAIDDQPIHYAVIRIAPEACVEFSDRTEVLSIRPFFRALVEEALELKLKQTSVQHYRHILQVIYDQLLTAPKHQHYLPQSHHSQLQPVLKRLSYTADFHLSLQQCLKNTHLSERQLLRLSQMELQMSLSEWRNRAKIIYALQQLKTGTSIKALSYQLGYQHSSSFIEFFKRYTGKTPSQLRE
ncbi:AraC family transcriptional regulator [Acinetobacter tianfuensis]|uniref:AraC family transcriptional regulator n=1 Tax=Acinetobacter tianfuensis TaxID=2419603 RepID=A0A3A8E3I9_9GAMM|nr:helix-turn-helix transcriptional regulator [Acinetobacter tianfuensis]RKG29235.1 AraC family transcriptional regulator [Acinetobacter tianfuensis]